MSEMPISFKKATGITSIKHNNRDFDEKDWENDFHKHIDRDRVDDNVILKQEPIRDAYERIFGSALKKYNDKQRRKDRKIGDYYAHIKKSKTLNTQYEFVVQVGRKEDFEANKANWALANEILIEYVNEFQERNPNFEIYNAVIHNDESSPHLHLNVIPVATGYKRGLERQPAFNKALENQGIELEKHDSRSIFKNFRDREISAVERSLNEKGIDRLEVGTNSIENHHEFKKIQREVDQLTLENDDLDQQLAFKRDERKSLNNAIHNQKTELAGLLQKQEQLRDTTPIGHEIEFKPRLGKNKRGEVVGDPNNVIVERKVIDKTNRIIRAFQNGYIDFEKQLKAEQEEKEQLRQEKERLEQENSRLTSMFEQISQKWELAKRFVAEHYTSLFSLVEEKPADLEECAEYQYYEERDSGMEL